MRLLVTAFEPFGGEEINPAKEAGRFDIIGDDGGFIRDFWRDQCG